jgi:hypothetical protein
VFWALAAFVVGASAWSIVPALYFQELAPQPKAASVHVCRDELEALERELSERSVQSLESRDATHHDAWLHEWDRRIALLDEQACGPLRGTRNDLIAARAALGQMLQRYAQDIAPAQRRVRAALDALQRAPNSPPHG